MGRGAQSRAGDVARASGLAAAPGAIRLISADTFGAIARGVGGQVLHPLLAPGFVAALARHGGRLGFGYGGRQLRPCSATSSRRRALTRRDKATFGEVFWESPHTRCCARGTVRASTANSSIPPRSRRFWSGDGPFAQTALLVHQIWLARGLRGHTEPAPPPAMPAPSSAPGTPPDVSSLSVPSTVRRGGA